MVAPGTTPCVRQHHLAGVRTFRFGATASHLLKSTSISEIFRCPAKTPRQFAREISQNPGSNYRVFGHHSGEASERKLVTDNPLICDDGGGTLHRLYQGHFPNRCATRKRRDTYILAAIG